MARSKVKQYSPPTARQLRDALPRASAASLRPCQKWNPAWGRNDVCQVSMRVASPGLRLECMYCPNVVRLDSTNRFVPRCEICARADTHTHRLQTPRRVHQYRNFGKLEYSERSRFVCTDCTGDIAMNQGQFQVQLCFCPISFSFSCGAERVSAGRETGACPRSCPEDPAMSQSQDGKVQVHEVQKGSDAAWGDDAWPRCEEGDTKSSLAEADRVQNQSNQCNRHCGRRFLLGPEDSVSSADERLVRTCECYKPA